MALNLTKSQVEDLAGMLEEGTTIKDLMKFFKCSAIEVYSFISSSILFLSDKRTPEHQLLREKILDILLGESVLKKALRVVSETAEKRSLKVTTLLNLTPAEKAELEKQGHANFIKEFKGSAVTLKVEETIDTIPPDLKILEKLLGLVEGNVSVEEVAKQITNFSEPDPATPEV